MVTHPFPVLQPERPGELARRLFLDVWSGDSIKAVSSGLLLPIVPLPLSVKILGERVLAPRFPIYSQMSISPSAAANGKGYWNTKSKEKENKTLNSIQFFIPTIQDIYKRVHSRKNPVWSKNEGGVQAPLLDLQRTVKDWCDVTQCQGLQD